MTRHEVFSSPELRAASRSRPLRFVLESLAVLVVATLLVLVPSTAGPREARAGAGLGPESGPTPLDRLAAFEVEAQRARRLP